MGSHIVLALARSGWSVVVLDDLSKGRLGQLHTGCQLVIGNASDGHLVRRTLDEHDIIAVIHLAQPQALPGLVRACAGRGLGAFVMGSHAAVYGPQASSPLVETTPCRPATLKGLVALGGERLLRQEARTRDLPHAIIRRFALAGADPLLRCGRLPGTASGLVTAACETALGARPQLDLYGLSWPTRDGSCLVDLIHVADLASLFVGAMEKVVATGQSCTLNGGSGTGHSVREVVATVARIAARPLAVRPLPARSTDVAERIASMDMARELLGWTPRYTDLGQIVRHTLAWERWLLRGGREQGQRPGAQAAQARSSSTPSSRRSAGARARGTTA
jgi:UDP-glucose 4-epimerase